MPSSSALIAALVLLTGCPSASSGVADADADASVDAAPTADHGGHDAPVAADAPEDAGPDGAPDAALAPVDPLTVATWNIEQFPKNSYSVDKVAEIIDERGFDLIAVQEISDPAAFDALSAALPGYEGIINEDPGAWLRVGILFRTSRLALDWQATEFAGDGWAFPRPPLVAAFTAPREDGSTAFDFVAVVLHLKAQIDAESESRRREACQKLDVWLSQQMALGAEQDYILLGDWNDKLNDPPEWNVFGTLLDKTDRYAFLTMPAALAGDISFLTYPGLIDHVMVTSDALEELGGGVTQTLRLDLTVPYYEADVSDHVPVVTTFELR